MFKCGIRVENILFKAFTILFPVFTVNYNNNMYKLFFSPVKRKHIFIKKNHIKFFMLLIYVLRFVINLSKIFNKRLSKMLNV